LVELKVKVKVKVKVEVEVGDMEASMESDIY
jgi:hypothetical protein